MKTKLLILLIGIGMVGCKSPEPRKPIKAVSGSYTNQSIERNKQLVAQEEAFIKEILAQDTINNYLISEQGFWYYYNTQLPEATEKADFGDVVEYKYNIKDIYGNIIYSEESIGVQTYHMDKQELMTGLREGLKILKEGETATFVFPSYKAYGYYGDLDKIGSNTPIISTVTLINIEQIN
jgi:gliding motility-associated peptidyl-prolyl isomerase